MPIIGAIGLGIAGGGAIVSGIGSIKQAAATSKAAQTQADAQRDIANRQIQFDQQRRAESMNLAQATPEELGRINQYLAQAQANYQQQMMRIQEQEQYIQSFDPVFKQAGQQALQLLQGQESAVLSPLRRQRDIQREQLRGRLRQQLGPGFETSSAGAQALNQFDVQSQDLFTQAQQSTLDRFMNYSQQGLSAGTQARSNAIGNLGVAQGALQNANLQGINASQAIQSRLVNASNATPINLQPLSDAAALQARASSLSGSNLQAIGGLATGLGNLGVLAGGMQQQQQILNENKQSNEYDRWVVNRMMQNYNQAPVTNFEYRNQSQPMIPMQQYNQYGQGLPYGR